MSDTPITTRIYGQGDKHVVVLHGGPGAGGYMAPVAKRLADRFHVLEPLQRGSSDVPLTVATHIVDLDEVISHCCPGARPAIIGHSWGAMLALAYAAAHPETAGPLVLIGCGTFDAASRAELNATIGRRMTDDVKLAMSRLEIEISDPAERLSAIGMLIQPIYSYHLSAHIEASSAECDGRAHEETWQDMLRLQENGVYPNAFSSISSPAIMFHGAYDPHPGRMIYDCLKRHMPQLEYTEWQACGHEPWREEEVHEHFYQTLLRWLNAVL